MFRIFIVVAVIAGISIGAADINTDQVSVVPARNIVLAQPSGSALIQPAAGSAILN